MATDILTNGVETRTCPWCSRQFRPRITGGKPQRFCGSRCRLAFFAAARAWSLSLLDRHLLSVETLKVAAMNVHIVCDPGQIDGYSRIPGTGP